MKHDQHKLFDDETENSLREIFEKLPRKLADYLVISNDPGECGTCSEAIYLAKELMRISRNKLRFNIIEQSSDVKEKLAVRYVPAFIYDTRKKNIRYYGIPSGQEFAPFIYMHQYIATGKLNLSGKVREIIETIETPLHIKVFVTPECPYCPLVVDVVNQMGLVNDELLIETIEAIELPLEADMYHVTYVPFITISDPRYWREYGAKPLEVIPGYISPEELAKVIYNASQKLGRS